MRTKYKASASEEFIEEVDADKKTIKVTLPQGILDLE